jgi:hypothetical protein
VISEANTSAVAKLQTAVEPSRPFHFFAYGDNGTNSGDHQAVVEQMLKVPGERPGLLVNVGDPTATGSDSDYQLFFRVEAPLIDHAPLFPCLGNHDLGNLTNYLTYFALPNNERWYSFQYATPAFTPSIPNRRSRRGASNTTGSSSR